MSLLDEGKLLFKAYAFTERRGTHGSLVSCSALAGASVTTLGKGGEGRERYQVPFLLAFFPPFFKNGYDRAVKTNLFLIRNFVCALGSLGTTSRACWSWLGRGAQDWPWWEL